MLESAVLSRKCCSADVETDALNEVFRCKEIVKLCQFQDVSPSVLKLLVLFYS